MRAVTVCVMAGKDNKGYQADGGPGGDMGPINTTMQGHVDVLQMSMLSSVSPVSDGAPTARSEGPKPKDKGGKAKGKAKDKAKGKGKDKAKGQAGSPTAAAQASVLQSMMASVSPTAAAAAGGQLPGTRGGHDQVMDMLTGVITNLDMDLLNLTLHQVGQ